MASIRQDKRLKKWFVDFYRGTTRKRFLFDSRRDAEAFRRVLLLRSVGIDPNQPEIKATPVREAVDRYLLAVTSSKAPMTQYFERIVFKDFSSYFKDAFLDDIKLAELQEYQSHLRRLRRGQSVNRRFTTLCHFFRQCLDWGLLKENPSGSLKKLPPNGVRAQRALQVEELKELLSTAKPWVRDILWFILVCGIRRSQACFLRWGAVDFKGRFIHFESSEGFDNKDYEANTLPMTETTEMFLKPLFVRARRKVKAGPNDFVFLDDRDEPIRPDRLTKEAKKLMKGVLGLETGAVHILRHTSLTLRHRQGVSLDAVRAIAGHSNVRTTMMYLHSEPEYLRQEMSRTPLLPAFWLEENGKLVSDGQLKAKKIASGLR